VQIELKLGTGSVKVLLPDEATADVDALVATMGAVKSNVASKPKPKLKPKPKAGATHFVVCGHTRGWDRSACGGAASSPGCVSTVSAARRTKRSRRTLERLAERTVRS